MLCRRAAGGALALLAALGLTACGETEVVKLRRENDELQSTLKQRDAKLAAQQTAIEEYNRQLAVARSISEEDLKRVFYPEQIVIDSLTGGYDSDGRPGDDGVTVYLRPVDHEGDVVKVPGDITIQLYDLAAAPNRNFIGEYKVGVDKCRELWHGKFLTNHYTIKCGWPKAPPEHPEITVRVTFVDYLTKRVLSAQSTCTVKLPPHDLPPPSATTRPAKP